MIRLLIAMIPMPGNRFLVDLSRELSKNCKVVQDHNTFWEMNGDFDIVNIHFPEYLTYEIEACLKKDLTPETIKAVKKRLRFWKEKASIVVTRHLFLPHQRSDGAFQKLYEVVYRYADAVVHFAEASRIEYFERYKKGLFADGQRHVIIPHHNYSSLPNALSREEARNRLGLPSDAQVMLVFGSIQSQEESRRIMNTFHNLRIPGKVLLASSWYENLPKVKWIRLKYWIRYINRNFYRLHPRYHFHYGFVEEQDVQNYVCASDIMFIPRGHVLNSGNMILAFTFGRVVVGPDSGNVGQILKENGNPVFDPDRPNTAVAAVTEAFKLAHKGIGKKNRALALSEWTVERCAEKYVELFKQLNDK